MPGRPVRSGLSRHKGAELHRRYVLIKDFIRAIVDHSTSLPPPRQRARDDDESIDGPVCVCVCVHAYVCLSLSRSLSLSLSLFLSLSLSLPVSLALSLSLCPSLSLSILYIYIHTHYMDNVNAEMLAGEPDSEVNFWRHPAPNAAAGQSEPSTAAA